MAQKKNTAEKVKDLIENAVNELGYEIWDVEYSKIGTERHLEITIDSEKGIDKNDPFNKFCFKKSTQALKE